MSIEINGNKYTRLNSNLGSGSYGSVEIVTNESGERLALKVSKFNKTDDDLHKKLLSVTMEISIIRNCTHPNVMNSFDNGVLKSTTTYVDSAIIVPIYNITVEDLMLMPNSPLMDYETVKYFSSQLFSGLAYLSQVGIIHRDIKPDNLMLDGRGILKIIDFGEAVSAGRELPHLEENAGTSYYKSPEFLLGSVVYDERVDAWAGACTVIAMFKGDLAFHELTDEAMHDIMYKMTPLDKRTQTFEEGKDPGDVYKTKLFGMNEDIEYDPDFTPLHLITNDTRREQVIESAKKSGDDEELEELLDFLRSCFEYDYDDRVNAESAIENKWISKYSIEFPMTKRLQRLNENYKLNNDAVDNVTTLTKSNLFKLISQELESDPLLGTMEGDDEVIIEEEEEDEEDENLD